MAVRWIQDGEPPLAGVYNRPLRDFIDESGWLVRSPNKIGTGVDIRTLPSGSYLLDAGHPQNPSDMSVTLIVQVSGVGGLTFMAQASGDYVVYTATSLNNPTGDIVWASIYHSRNQLNIGKTPESARDALGLGNGATWNIGTSVNTIAAGNDSRIVNAASVTYVNSGLNAKANQSTQILTSDGLIGGGNLGGNRTIRPESSAIPKTAKLLTTEDLNTISTPGYYYQPLGSMSTTGRNYPPTILAAGTLVVTISAGIIQEYTAYFGSLRKYIRGLYNGKWSDWVEFYSTKNQLNIGETPATARSTMGLGNISTRDVGTTPGTAADGGDNRFMPTGAVMTFAGQYPPNGWLRANGVAVSRASYPSLFAAIGTIYGAGNGSTTFNLPDMRGMFARGADDGRGVDRGRTVGSFQDDQIEMHNHYLPTSSGIADDGIYRPSPNIPDHLWEMTNTNTGARDGWPSSETYPSSIHSQSRGATGSLGKMGPETRPKNIALLYCIKI